MATKLVISRLKSPKSINGLLLEKNYASIGTCPVQNEELSWEEAKPYNEIPGPKSYPIFGNLFKFLPYIGI